MKKIIALTLAVLLILSLAACGSKTEAPAENENVEAAETAEVSPEVTPEPTPTEPEWEPGMARAGYGKLVYTTLNRGDIVNVIGQWKDHYIIEGDEVDLLVEKAFVRLDSEGKYESWTGYAKWGAQAFDNVRLEGEAILDLYVNQQVTVVDGNDNWLYIEWEGGSGYIDKEYISSYYIDAGNGGYSEGGYTGGNGGSSGGGNGGGGNPGGGDNPGGGNGGGGSTGGGDINLDLVSYFGPAKEDMKEMAYILADDVDAYLCITLRGDELKVTSVNDEECQIWMEGFTAVAPRWLIQLAGDEAYKAHTAYSYSGVKAYEEYQMVTELMTLDFNTEVKVLDKLSNCYVIEVNGQIAYVALDSLSENAMNVYTGGYSDGGSSGGGGGYPGGGGGNPGGGGGDNPGGDGGDTGGGIWTGPII